MDHNQFQELLSAISRHSPAQKQQVQSVLQGKTKAVASLEAIEAKLAETRMCPRCDTPGSVSRGKAWGLRRYKCKVCKRTFKAATGTALQGVHKKERWLTYGECLADGLTIRESAERCNIAVSTSFFWRHRFLGIQEQTLPKLKGIVEAVETYVLENRKGDRKIDRKALRRGGKSSKQGLSDEQVPILVTVDRTGTTSCSVLSSVAVNSIQCALEPRIDEDILLVTDGNNVYSPCSKALGVKRKALNQSTSERIRSAFHIQTTNNRHSGIKGFLRDYRGVSSKYLEKYVRWYERRALLKSSSSSYLTIATGVDANNFKTERLLLQARSVLDCPDPTCVRCYTRCLNDYSNQRIWHQLDRRSALTWIEAKLIAASVKITPKSAA